MPNDYIIQVEVDNTTYDIKDTISGYITANDVPQEILLVNVTITSQDMTTGTSDVASEDILSAASQGKLPVVHTYAGTVSLTAVFSRGHVDPSTQASHVYFTYEDQSNEYFRYATMEIVGTNVTITFKEGYVAIGDNVSSLVNDAGYLSSYTETDPTVPSWAKAASKPTYTYSEVGALSAATSIPTETTVSGWGFTKNTGTVTGVKMNGTTLAPTSGVVDIGTVLSSYTETDPTVPSWAKASSKPTYTYSEVGALSAATAIPDAVSFSQILSSGTSIATITIGATTTSIYAPAGGGGGSTTFRRWS